MNRIRYLKIFLKNKNLIKEATFLEKVAKQLNYSLDQQPYKIELPLDVKVDDIMVEYETEACRIVNFGIENLEKKYGEKLKSKTKFFPEEVNLIHFDLNKLINCMILNEKSKKDLSELGYSLSSKYLSTRYQIDPLTVDRFLNIFKKYPHIYSGFQNVLKNDMINYVLIGTSETPKDFFEKGEKALLFHQNTPKYVVHDMGHAIYDQFLMSRSDFKPIEIMASYLKDVMKEFNKYIILYNKGKSGGAIDILNFFKSFFKEKEVRKKMQQIPISSMQNSYSALDMTLRMANHIHDLRYLVGTINKRPKSFTGRVDFDQDFFAYIMMSNENIYDLENDKLLNVFKEPMLPPTMDEFFNEFFPRYKERFLEKISKLHKDAMKAIQEDLDKNTSETSGYVSKLVRKSHENIAGSVIVFNMMGDRLKDVEKEKSDKLIEKGYTESPTGTRIITKSKDGKRADRFNVLSGLVDEAVLSEDGSLGKIVFVGDLGKDQERWLKGAEAFGKYTKLKDGDIFYVNEKFKQLLESPSIQKKLDNYFYSSNPYTISLNTNDDIKDDFPYILTIKDYSDESELDINLFVLFFTDIEETYRVIPEFIDPENIDFDNIETQEEDLNEI